SALPPAVVSGPGCSNPNVSVLSVSSARPPKPWLPAPGLLPPLQPPHMYTIILSVLGQIVQADQDVDFVARSAIASSPMPSHNRASSGVDADDDARAWVLGRASDHSE